MDIIKTDGGVDYNIEKKGDVDVLSVNGRLDTVNYLEMQAIILDMIEKGSRKFVIDLGGLEYISSAGIRVFFVALKKLKPLGGKLVFASLQDAINKIFKMAGFDIMFSIFDNIEGALENINKG